MITPLVRMTLTMSVLVATAGVAASGPPGLEFDRDPTAWRVVVDGVMGGRSSGQVGLAAPGVLRFTGTLSLENNGGFSQIRTDVPGDRFVGTRGIELRVRGDGRTYKFDVRCSHVRVMAGGFQQDFRTEAGTWTTIRLPFEGFRLYSFGRRVPGAPALEPARIESIGVTLADEEQGPFRLEVDWIRTFGDATAVASVGAARLCDLAIGRGAPLLDAGRTEGCAAIYEVAVEALLALGEAVLERDVVQRLETALREAETQEDWSERARTYRRALDAARARLAGRVEPAAASTARPRQDGRHRAGAGPG